MNTPLVISTLSLHFGLGYTGTLPEGWILRESEEEWAIGIDLSGRHHFLSPTHAYPVLPITNRKESILAGAAQLDDENPILLTVSSSLINAH